MLSSYQQDLQRIQPVLDRLVGRPTIWNGTVQVVPAAALGMSGAKTPSCLIILAEENRFRPAHYWPALIHESLHARSEDFSHQLVTSYSDMAGWEEGVVEQLARRLRLDIMLELGISLDEAALAARDRQHRYNRWIAELERLRLALRMPENQFYLDLLAIPLEDRPAGVERWARQRLPAARQAGFARLLAEVDKELQR